jgi:hypothetical protein
LGVQRVRQPQHDTVIGAGYLRLDTSPFPQPGADRQRPWPVDLRAERGVHHHPPVTQLVAETLHQDSAVVGHVPGGFALFAQVGQQVRGCPLVEPSRLNAAACRVHSGAAQLADERAQCPP